MKIRITMVNGITYDFTNNHYKTVDNFIDNQLCGVYYVVDVKLKTVIRTSNIVEVQFYD